MTVSSKIRIYDLAKELKLDTKRLIEEVRREGVDVSVPSNSVSKELAEKIRNKYFPKKETAIKRGVRVVKRAERAVEEPAAAEVVEAPAELAPYAEVVTETQQPEPPPATVAPDAAKPATMATTAKLRKLTPAVRAEQPETDISPELAPTIDAVIEAEATNGSSAEAVVAEAAEPAQALTPAAPAPPPARQIRVMRPTVAALNAGIRPGERAPTPVAPPTVTPRERADRATRVRERTPLAKTERLGTPGETATPQTTYIPPPDAGRRRSRRTPTRGGRKVDGKGGRFDKG
ncbi:MAG TPA: translation initiation factor IF-2 N-terminal domain-containing protein, partial [Pyrinomonadaceae bacterium]